MFECLNYFYFYFIAIIYIMVKLEDYTITELKKMISSFNKIIKFSAYSKMKKAELINMLRHHKRIIVEEGANGVKIMIDTEEDFKKQTKVKKEKVKKEVKKEVEKLDDVKVDVDVDKKEEPEEKPKKKFKFKVKEKKEEPLTVTKADGTVKELKMKPKKKKSPTEKQLAARKQFTEMQKAKKKK